MNRWSRNLVALLAIFVLSPLSGHAQDKHALVHFGEPQPQSTPAAATHLLLPDDVTIQKGGTVTFVVNGGGHGIIIHRVNKKTTREDIAEDLCQGGADEADRVGRSTVCNGTIVTPSGIVGTQNVNYDITDAKSDLIIRTGENTAATPNPRIDDTEHSERLLSTSGRSEGDQTAPGANPAGAFLAGSAAPATPGTRINVQFLKTGRYLVMCQNRGHALNDHMFGFVSVVGDDDEDEGGR